MITINIINNMNKMMTTTMYSIRQPREINWIGKQ